MIASIAATRVGCGGCQISSSNVVFVSDCSLSSFMRDFSQVRSVKNYSRYHYFYDKHINNNITSILKLVSPLSNRFSQPSHSHSHTREISHIFFRWCARSDDRMQSSERPCCRNPQPLNHRSSMRDFHQSRLGCLNTKTHRCSDTKIS